MLPVLRRRGAPSLLCRWCWAARAQPVGVGLTARQTAATLDQTWSSCGTVALRARAQLLCLSYLYRGRLSRVELPFLLRGI